MSVSNISAAEEFYTRLFGRPRDNNPMPNLVEWRLNDGGWLQVHEDTERAGATQVNFAVDDLTALRTELTGRGLRPGAEEQVNKGVRLSLITDPDGNRITFVGSFRVVY
ncbi:VOC family protein [Prauserella cavernicola]|nr:VOC family protein [Prauserella cavernicola]